MPKFNLLSLLGSLLVLFPVLVEAQYCNTGALPATAPTSRYVRYDNGTVLDKYTDLMWKACSEGQTWNNLAHSCDQSVAAFNWDDMFLYVESFNAEGGFAAYTDWRIPNIKELLSLVERQCVNPAINLEVFPNTDPENVFWTSTRRPPYFARTVIFSLGQDGGLFRTNFSELQLRLVRN